MIEPVSIPKFLMGWLPALAVTSVADTPQAGILLTIGGVVFPLVTCALGLLGIVAARFLALPQERMLGTARFLTVSLIMLVALEVWIIESQPGWLFAFVVSIGLGFSGYSLIQLLGDETKRIAQSFFELARERLGSMLGKKDG